MATVRETALAAFKTKLAANSRADEVYRNRKDAIAAAEVTNKGVWVVEDGGMDRDDGNSAEDRYRLRVRCWGYCQAPDDGDGEDVGTIISEMHASAVKAITTDPTLGGAVEYCTEANMEDPEWDQNAGTRDNASFAIGFTLEFVTKVGDPTQAP